MKKISIMNKNMEKMAGGRTMKDNDIDAKKFSRVLSQDMFPKIHKSKKPHIKETPNPDKEVKPLKKMKGAQ